MLELNEFTCRKCGNNKLTYRKWVQCDEDIIINENNYIEYCQPVIDPDNDLGYCNGYVCQNCGKAPTYYGSLISTERVLITYLMLDQNERDEDEQLYRELVQEQTEKEVRCGLHYI